MPPGAGRIGDEIRKKATPQKRGGGIRKGVRATGAGVEATGAGVQATGAAAEVAGRGLSVAGRGVGQAGRATTRAGVALSSTGVGAIVGVPLAAIGGAATIGGAGTSVAGKGISSAGRGMRRGGRAAGRAGRKARKAARGKIKGLDELGGGVASSVAGFALVLVAFTVDIIQIIFTITLLGTIVAGAIGGLMFWVFPQFFKIAKVKPLGLIGGVLWMAVRVLEVLPFLNAFIWFTIAMVGIAMYSAMAQMRS